MAANKSVASDCNEIMPEHDLLKTEGYYQGQENQNHA